VVAVFEELGTIHEEKSLLPSSLIRLSQQQTEGKETNWASTKLLNVLLIEY